MKSLFSKISDKLWHLLSAFIILAALLVSLTGLLTPVLNKHRTDFEKLASTLLNTPVMIGNVKVSWHGYSPEINLENVSVLDMQTQKPKVEVDRLLIDFSIWRSLWTRQIAVKNITVSGVKLTLHAEKSGQIQIGNLGAFNIKDSSTGASVETDKAAAWIFSQPRLALANIDVHFISPLGPERYITLQALALKNDGEHHSIEGKVTLNQKMPTRIAVHIAWEGDVRKMQMKTGDFYLYLESLSLPQWFSKMSLQGIQVKKGLASIKLWAKWQDSHWNTLQSTFQVYGLETYSAVTKTSEKVERISANVGWKQEGNTQILAGDEIFIDFPQHLWPETRFEVIADLDASGDRILKKVSFNYLDLADVARLALETSALPDSARQLLVSLEPQGELKGFDSTLTKPLMDLSGLTLKTQFAGLTLNAWKSFPAVTLLDGALSWDKTEGALDLNETHATLALPKLFAKSFHLDQLLGTVRFSHDATGSWIINAKNISVKTPDANATASLSLTLPVVDSPQIDLTADFAVSQAAHIADYLPVKTFDPDLAEWLTLAFKKGHTDTGKAVIQGKLADFPFENNTGKFLITTAVHDTDLLFAPGWPMLTNVEGVLTFSGRVMTVDVSKGAIMDIPFTNIRAGIPYIGDNQPQILHVDGLLSGDLAQGMRFIQASPLQKTIGRDLKGMNLTGPMQLSLNLVVPVKHPGLSTVNGAVTMTNAIMDLPDWKLTMNNLNGQFQFTEKGLEAKNITATLFDSPAVLNITTLNQPKESGQVRADFTGQVTIPQLEKWLSVSLSPVAKGAMSYQAQLFLSGHDQSKPSQVVIQSDLKGVSVNAPLNFGKKADQTKNLQVAINVGDNSAMNAKVDYDKLLSAAMSLTKSGQSYQLYGGEVHLGGGDAQFQKAKGLLITGQMPVLDWDLWQTYFESFKKQGVASSTPGEANLLRGVDLRANIINVANQQLHQAHIDVTFDDAAWLIKVESQELAGDVTLPLHLAGNKVVGHFHHIYLESPSSKKSSMRSLNPAAIPMLSIESDNVRISGIDFGHVVLNTVPSQGGMLIKQLKIEEPYIELNATGDWFGNAGHSKSHLQGEVTSSRISEVLNNWGFDTKNYVGSTGNINFNLGWSDAPYRPTLEGLTGDLSLKLGEGRIVELSESSNAKIGLGRMLNLFSLSTIPRRLSLNFSDLFEKGYAFDSLTADFLLRSGSAFTDNMRFNGPIARVDIKGRVGLKGKDFDLQLGVTPYVTGSLPLVATLAGGPVAGVATWVVDKVITSQASRSITYQYSVKGTWSNPVWSEISEQPQHPSFNTVFPFSLFSPQQSGALNTKIAVPHVGAVSNMNNELQS